MFDIQDKIYSFLERANRLLGKEDSFFYGGSFITGEINNPDILFLGINPGFGCDWSDRTFTPIKFNESECKYIEEAAANLRLAKQVVEIICDGEVDKLKWCAESSVRSFFATPNEIILNKSLAKLSPELRREHDDLIVEAIKLINPRQVVCIGFSAFNTYINRFNSNLRGEIETKSCLTKSGKNTRVYYKKTIIEGLHVHGILHLSGAHISSIAFKGMKDEFTKIFSSLAPNENPFRGTHQYDKAKFFQRYLNLAKRCISSYNGKHDDYDMAHKIAIDTLKELVENYDDSDNFAWSVRQSIKAKLLEQHQ